MKPERMEMTTAQTVARRARRGPFRRVLDFVARHVVLVAAMATVAYLLLPIAVVVMLSFNRPAGRYNYTWNEFTWHNWTHLCGVEGMCSALTRSLQIAGLTTVGATILGSLIAFALARHRFRGRSATNLLVILPLTTPEVVLGASLLTLFVNMKMPLGFWTILIAHITFCLSFVVITVKARLAGFDGRLEEAAMDLYASRWRTFRRVTLPLAMPGIVAAALLAFALSFDDFIVTNFNSGSTVTFPMYVWGSARRGVPAQVNVIGTLMFVMTIVVVLVAQVVASRRKS